ncbi:MAG: hypothetical protein HN742_27070 [Lentisphaerae bacterium]|jgi:hypothetical protein|nr:hypothetical protein [Lentisphaerota bacterium]MBT4814059.1 hypothetical protein [Lentisphaerota bacterium]MBT5607842.1 hypothetical protein [Lentisphaerota bacterium]MBT7054824.1 hypothetical protein [Lentisphaerota bacterium]MBT7845564.1 hypothetical protein [Lentisphaerota bacterium]
MTRSVRIGWATRDITPDRPVSLRGLFNLRIATRTKDPLTLTALAIDNGDEHAVIVSMDACAVDQEVLDRVRQEVGNGCSGLDSEKVVASATHTHTAPFSGGTVGLQKDADYLEHILAEHPDYMSTADYTDFIVEAMVSAVCEAWESRSPGALAWGYGYAVVGENRRIRYFDDRAVMYGSTALPDFSHVEGHVDHGVHLLFTYDTEHALTGVLVNVACPSQSTEGGQDFVSADYWHEVRLELRRRYGEGLSVLPQCSAAGDQTPHRQVDTRAEERMMKLKYGQGLSRGDNSALRQDIARRIGIAVDDVETAVRQDLRPNVEMEHVQLELELPHWNVTDKEYEDVSAQIAGLDATIERLGTVDPIGRERTSARSRRAWCARVQDRYDNPPGSISVQVNVLRLGDVAFVTCPFEYYLDFGDRIKGRSPAIQTFVAQLAGSGSYLATERAAAGCSYGAVPASCKVSPAGGQLIVDRALEALTSMFKQE